MRVGLTTVLADPARDLAPETPRLMPPAPEPAPLPPPRIPAYAAPVPADLDAGAWVQQELRPILRQSLPAWILALLAGIALTLALPSIGWPAPAPEGEPQSGGAAGQDPAAHRPKRQRGGTEETEQFRKHRLPSERGPKKASAAPSAPSAPEGGAISTELAPGERPAVQLLKKQQAAAGAPPSAGSQPLAPSVQPQAPAQPPAPAPMPQAADNSQAPSIQGEIIVEYELPADAEVSVSILGSDGAQVRQFSIPAGAEGGRKGLNRIAYWDGRDASGAPAPAGEYVAVQTIAYPAADGSASQAETRVLRLPGTLP